MALTKRPSRRARLLVAVMIATFSAVFLIAFRPRPALLSTDLDQTLLAARLLWRGQDPYTLIGPRLAYPFQFPWYYPLPAAVVVMPVAWLPFEWANVVFVGLSAAALAYGLTRDGWQRLPLFLSASYFWTAWSAQWSALLLAAFFLPAIATLGIAKPNIAVASTVTSRRHLVLAVIGGVALLAISLAARPTWPVTWIALVRHGGLQRSAVLYPGGFVMLAALSRWRRPEARWFLALSIIPQTPGPYSDLLLFAVPSTTRETLVLTLLSHVPLPFSQAMNTLPTIEERIVRYGALVIPFLFVPCLLMVLRRPNEGAVPEWIERKLAGAPAWLRGQPLDPLA
jgi:hypothetical protein